MPAIMSKENTGIEDSTSINEMTRNVSPYTVTKVDTLSFAGQPEVTDKTTEVKDKMIYSLTISAFYMPSLMDLQGQMPTLEVPKGCGKVNPFVEGLCDEE